MTKRPVLHLDPEPSGWLKDDRSECRHFMNTLPTRYACTLCSRGDTIEQHPHFDDIVCTRHDRWLGLWGSPAEQHAVDPLTVEAQRVFAKLRTKNLIDVRLYLYLTNAFNQALHPTLGIEQAEPLVFPHVARTVHAITLDAFARRFFNPAGTFSDAFTYLNSTLADAVGREIPAITRALWIYLRPTMHSLRDAITLQQQFTPTWQHEYPIRPSVANSLAAFRGALEPAENYLAITGDTPVTAATTTADLSMLRPATEETELRHFTCSNGHEFDYLPPVVLPATMTPSRYTPTCGHCTPRRVRPGVNDLESQSPKAAAQFDIYRNGGLTAADVASNSSINHWWICPEGHSHEVSPSKKTLPTYNCPICSNRVVRYRANCMLTTDPEYAAMWADGWSETRSPATLSGGANARAQFRCVENGHLFTARPWELTSGKRGCDLCVPERTIDHEKCLAVTHPDVAARWHPTRNDGLTPEDVTYGERREVWWLCENGHPERARIDKMTYGRTCSKCAHRTLSIGETDLASTDPVLSLELHPTLNEKKAHELFPSDHVLAWQCIANGHPHWQTTQNRRSSLGCPRCRPTERILYQAMKDRHSRRRPHNPTKRGD